MWLIQVNFQVNRYAAAYVELNLVKVKIVTKAEDFRWGSDHEESEGCGLVLKCEFKIDSGVLINESTALTS